MARGLTVIPFREVRHDRAEDGLYYEPLELRGRLHEWTVPVHCHETLHQFGLVTRGSVIATIDDVQHSLEAPAVWLVAPHMMHGFIYEPDSAGHLVSVPTPLLQAAFASSRALSSHLAHSMVADVNSAGDDLDEVADLFEKIAREFGVTRPGRAEALRGYATLLALWFARSGPAPTAAGRQSESEDVLVERYRILIEQKFREHWPVRRYAGALGVTVDHLSRRCRVATGLSAFDVAHERLILEARRMLAFTRATVAEIAHKLGFDDPNYFSRVFTKSVGQSPVTYRSAAAKGLATPPPRQIP
jgi:AraC family transcriptional regulator, transcriptional activator of pobA